MAIYHSLYLLCSALIVIKIGHWANLANVASTGSVLNLSICCFLHFLPEKVAALRSFFDAILLNLLS